MADPKLVEMLKQRSEAWNQWRQHQRSDTLVDLEYADLKHANLSYKNLSYTYLSGAHLGGADLYRTDLSFAILHNAILGCANLGCANLGCANLHSTILSGAILHSADLHDADLRGADLRSAYLRRANLHGSNLREANLNDADLSFADLSFADLGKAQLAGTVFSHVDLSTTKGLASISHHGPSSVELHTVKLPQDGSALHFLRGCGVPDEWIDFYRAAVMSPIQYHSCFISYSSQDDTIAKRLHADLQAQGVRCWFAPHDMRIGDKIRPRIDEAVQIQDKSLLLLSEHAIASGWVEDEVEIAYEKERLQNREVIFPIRLDGAIMSATEAWARKLRDTRHIGDFTRWADPQAYDQAFGRLLRDLKKQT